MYWILGKSVSEVQKAGMGEIIGLTVQMGEVMGWVRRESLDVEPGV